MSIWLFSLSKLQILILSEWRALKEREQVSWKQSKTVPPILIPAGTLKYYSFILLVSMQVFFIFPRILKFFYLPKVLWWAYPPWMMDTLLTNRLLIIYQWNRMSKFYRWQELVLNFRSSSDPLARGCSSPGSHTITSNSLPQGEN